MPAATPAAVDPSAPVLVEELHSAKSQANSVHPSPDNSQLATGCQDGVVVLWHLQPRPRAFRYIGHQAPVSSVHFSPHGNLVVSASQDRTIRLWVPKVRGGSTVLHAHQGAVRAAQFFPGGDRVVTGADDKVVKMWCITTQKAISTFAEHTNWVRCVSVSPDGRLGGSGGDDKTAKLWDFAARQPRSVHTLMHHCDSVTDLAFGPDGHSLATCGVDRTLKLFDLRTYRLLQHYDAHSDAVRHIAWHPSGHFLLSCSQDSTIKVWDLRVGYLFYTLSAHAGPVNSVSFSADGATFISAGVDHKVLLWRSNFDREADAALDKGRGPAVPSAKAPRAAGPTQHRASTPPSLPPPPLPPSPPPLPPTGSATAASPLDGAPAIPVDVNGETSADAAACLEYVLRQVDLLSHTLALIEGRTTSTGDIAHDCANNLQRVDQRLTEYQQASTDTSVELLQTVKQLASRMETLEESMHDKEVVQQRQLEGLRAQVEALARENVALRRQVAEMHMRDLQAPRELPQRLSEVRDGSSAPKPVSPPGNFQAKHDPSSLDGLALGRTTADGPRNGPFRASIGGSIDLHSAAASPAPSLHHVASNGAAASSVLYSSGTSSVRTSAGATKLLVDFQPEGPSADTGQTFRQLFGLSLEHASMLPPSVTALHGPHSAACPPQPSSVMSTAGTSPLASYTSNASATSQLDPLLSVSTAATAVPPSGPPWTSPLSLWTAVAGLSAPDHMVSPEGVQRSLVWSTLRPTEDNPATPPADGSTVVEVRASPMNSVDSTAPTRSGTVPQPHNDTTSKKHSGHGSAKAPSASAASRHFGIPDDVPVDDAEEA